MIQTTMDYLIMLNGLFHIYQIKHLNIIIITKAEHLFSNKTFISDIYEQVKEFR